MPISASGKLILVRKQNSLAQSSEPAFGGRIISLVRNAYETKTSDVTVRKVLDAIRSSGERLKGQITQIRNQFELELAKSGGDVKAAKRAVEKLKTALLGVMWSGQYSSREHPAADKLEKHSGLFIGDCDDLGDRLPQIRKKLEASLHVFALFLSPSGNGLKAVFRVPADAQKHAGSFRAVEAHVKQLTGIQIDESGKDIGRLCFMSYDPELYHNPKAIEIEPLPEPEKPEKSQPAGGTKGTTNKSIRRNGKPSKAKIREVLGFIPKRPDYPDWIKLVAAVGDALSDEDAIKVLNEWSPEEHPGEYADKLRNRLTKIHVGTLFQKAKDYGWEPSSSRKSAATELVQLAEGFEFFHDRQDRPFVRLENNGHSEVWPVESAKFRKLLARMFYRRSPNSNPLS
jgi:hypothetical protein